MPRKQRHTAHRIFERLLRDEHGFTGGYTIVKDYVRSQRKSVREAFVPLHHPPGHAQVDFGEAVVEIGGLREKIAFFCLSEPTRSGRGQSAGAVSRAGLDRFQQSIRVTFQSRRHGAFPIRPTRPSDRRFPQSV